MSNYRAALEAAGATVHAFKEFGSYQGEWYADVTFRGERGWINGAYGSCSVCDAFEAECDYSEGDGCDAHRYAKREDCLGCKASDAAYRAHLSEFGRVYLDAMITQGQAERNAAEYAQYSLEDQEALDWLKAQNEVRPTL